MPAFRLALQDFVALQFHTACRENIWWRGEAITAKGKRGGGTVSDQRGLLGLAGWTSLRFPYGKQALLLCPLIEAILKVLFSSKEKSCLLRTGVFGERGWQLNIPPPPPPPPGGDKRLRSPPRRRFPGPCLAAPRAAAGRRAGKGRQLPAGSRGLRRHGAGQRGEVCLLVYAYLTHENGGKPHSCTI